LTDDKSSSRIRHVSNAGCGHTGNFFLAITKCGLVVLTALTMIPIILVSPANHGPTYAASDAARWCEVNTPDQGISNGWVLAEGSDIRNITESPDGTLYASAEGLSYTLYKSTDGGITWSAPGKVTDEIIGIAVSPRNPDYVYYATSATVYRSTDGGATFQQLPPHPGNAGSGNIEITSIDVTSTTADIIAIGTRDKDNAEYGGVYILDETILSYVWTDSDIGSYDAYSLAFSPGYPQDGQLIAVITDEADTQVTVKSGANDWGSLVESIKLSRDNIVPHSPVLPLESAIIAFPSNYGNDLNMNNCVFYLGVNTGGGKGDVYRVDLAISPGTSAATDLNAGLLYGYDNIDVSALGVTGSYPNSTVMVGSADSQQIYFTTDSGTSWNQSLKPPTGNHVKGIIIPGDFAVSKTVYAATGGTDSAFSVTRDGGDTWNQLSLIDNRISTIVDMVPSPDYDRDNTLFMITFGNGHSLWRSQTGGDTWERILSGSLDGIDTLTGVGLPPQYGDDQPTVFLTGESQGKTTVWESIDNGRSYRARRTRDPATGTNFPIDTWAITDATTLFIGSYNGSESVVYKTVNGGFFFFEGAPAGQQPLNSLALSPDYQNDGHIIAGNTNGGTYWSNDGGLSFQSLPLETTTAPLTGQVAVACDAGYATDATIYAASNAADGGIYRYTIGESTTWEAIDNTLPSGTRLDRPLSTSSGALYAVNSLSGEGMERSLSPVSPASPTFETVSQGLGSESTLYGLWQSGNRLWSIDTTNIALMTYNDTLTVPVSQISPDDEDTGIGDLADTTVKNIKLDWSTLEGASGYEWQCQSDANFTSSDDLGGITSASSVKLPPLEPAATYYWRVRASSPVLSPWSEKRSFTTTLDVTANGLELENPPPGANDVPIHPLFQWEGIGGADAYELMVGDEPDFSNPVIAKENPQALLSNAWLCDIELEYNTAYFWKVRAINGNTRSPWSSVGAFTTELDPLETPGTVAEATLPTNPSPLATQPVESVIIQQTTAPNGQPPYVIENNAMPAWVPYVIGGQAVIIVFALIIILVLVSRRRQF
jgi:photosystem II stability/assembly factor-like uncharacterized protein